MNKLSDKYDVVIIGAGIGGLVCGCYLAKGGMKVLIIEKNDFVGGCCTSFLKKGFKFDAAVFSLGGCSENGNIGKVILDHNLSEFVDIKRPEITDIVIGSSSSVTIDRDIKYTIDSFSTTFPNERKNVKLFFNYITKSSFSTLYYETKNMTFLKLLNKYFKSESIKNILSLFLGSAGMPADTIPAFVAILLYKEYVLDGGYYPRGGIQSFPDALKKRFIKYGGQLKLSDEVVSVKIKDSKMCETTTAKKVMFKSKLVVANCSPHALFYKLLNKENMPKKYLKKMEKLSISLSAFLIYLGLANKTNILKKNIGKIWYCGTIDINNYYSDLRNDKAVNLEQGFLISSPSSKDSSLAPAGMENICIMTLAPYKNIKFWSNHREKIETEILRKMEVLFPGLNKEIIVRSNATPITIERYTGNSKGAAYGWESTLGNNIPQLTPFSNLILVGHWTPHGSGITRVCLSGRLAALHILNNAKVLNKESDVALSYA
ncbi:MAG: NAD(P)/FAD-dependent oxidoreductase [Candidatus Omnitrophota bacterium]|nr:NAD(P)/FAD-dependent oxidoreductase [Candidatus Omnitrophota bacterium]